MEINYLALIVAALVPMALGFIYYNPKVVGNAWMEAAGVTEEKMKGANMALIFGLSFVFSLMMAFVMNIVAYHDGFVFGAMFYALNGAAQPEAGSELAKWFEYYQTNLAESNHTFKHGAFHGLLIAGLFIALPVIGTNALFERKSFKYILINGVYWLICFALMGGIVAAWH
ncbi:MAG: DUF1761 domain-containing protein [Saprospiraceae bacterium]|nr:DUF1761 domain-containing protein [Saprospiraceae bacterium]